MIVACVRTGDRYPVDHVARLRNMVARYMPFGVQVVCLTDRPHEMVPDVFFLDISKEQLPGWWGKMALFRTGWRAGHRVIYFDLDTVICGSLKPLASLDINFGICGNFTRLAGNTAWPCRYGSCVMVLGERLDDHIWVEFKERQRELMEANKVYGDQRAIEEICPSAILLQHMLPHGFLASYRDLKEDGPGRAAIINFGGKNKPATCNIEWVRQAWL